MIRRSGEMYTLVKCGNAAHSAVKVCHEERGRKALSRNIPQDYCDLAVVG